MCDMMKNNFFKTNKMKIEIYFGLQIGLLISFGRDFCEGYYLHIEIPFTTIRIEIK